MKNDGWDKCPDNNFISYVNKCNLFAINSELFNNFKRDEDYQRILEGGEYVVGEMAINNILAKNKFQYLLNILDKIKWNDIFGNPILREYSEIGKISPSTLRYFVTLLEIQELMKEFKPKKIVEVGGGYGGLCYIISCEYDFDEYILVDLPSVIKLCKIYISKFPELKGKVKFINSTESTPISNIDLFISDSAFAECGIEYQNKYIENYIINSKYSYTTFNTLHLSQSSDEINNYLSKLSAKKINNHHLDDKIVYTTEL